MKTAEGVKLISIMIVLYLLTIAMMLSLTILVYYGFTDFFPLGSGSTGGNDYGTLGVVLSFSFIPICIVSLLVYVLCIIGSVRFFQGRYEFGPKHKRMVKIGIILIVLSIVIFFIPYIKSISGPVQGLGLVCLIVSIARKRERVLLWISFSIMMLVFVLSLIHRVEIEMDIFPRNIVMGILIGSWLSTSISYILLFLGYYWTYRGIKNNTIRPNRSFQKKKIKFKYRFLQAPDE